MKTEETEEKRELMICKDCGHIYGRGTNNLIPSDKKCRLCNHHPKLREARIG